MTGRNDKHLSLEMIHLIVYKCMCLPIGVAVQLPHNNKMFVEIDHEIISITGKCFTSYCLTQKFIPKAVAVQLPPNNR